MLLHDLLDATDVLEFLHDAPVDVSDVTHDSRAARPGALFCCVSGSLMDGHDFAPGAVERGAVALLVERDVAPTDPVVPHARVLAVRDAMGPVAARLHGDPSHHLPVVGITGTNGKTTTTFLLEGVCAEARLDPAVLGTVGVRFRGRVEDAAFTTPEAPDLQRTLANLRARGAGVVAMEVSSHSLAERRVDGTRFAAVGFTNLSHEHLDYHESIDAYFAAKARLFTPPFSTRAAINVDDAHGRELVTIAARGGVDVITYGIEPSDRPRARPDVYAEGLIGNATATTFRLHVRNERVDVELPIPARFNVANALAAAALATVLDIDLGTIAAGLGRASVIPGRFERIVSAAPVTVIVDYAHTPDGIETALRAARGLTDGRVIAVFGCGGDRDRGKRSRMGVAAGRGADVVVLTNDNPRSEEPAAIAAEAAEGLRAVDANYSIELDRRRAIRSALTDARPGDTVVILGKGAERAQTTGDVVVPFDDRIVAAEELESTWT